MNFSRGIKVLVIVNLLISAGAVYYAYQIKNANKIAFVRSQVVLDKYSGMHDARKVYEKKIAEWQSNLDSLKYTYNRSLQSAQLINAKADSNSNRSLAMQEKIISDYSQSVEQKATEENEKLTQGVLNQVNEYIKTYAKEKNYKLVLGVTLSGNILYGADNIDITEEIIEGLNKEYSNK